MKTRQQLIGDLQRLLDEVEQIFIDCRSWNENVRKPQEAPIDPDPSGDMKRLADEVRHVLATDTGSGPLKEIRWRPSH